MVAPGFNEQDFLDLMDRIENHLAMVFHRYLEGPSPRLRLTINGKRVAPLGSIPFEPSSHVVIPNRPPGCRFRSH